MVQPRDTRPAQHTDYVGEYIAALFTHGAAGAISYEQAIKQKNGELIKLAKETIDTLAERLHIKDDDSKYPSFGIALAALLYEARIYEIKEFCGFLDAFLKEERGNVFDPESLVNVARESVSQRERLVLSGRHFFAYLTDNVHAVTTLDDFLGIASQYQTSGYEKEKH